MVKQAKPKPVTKPRPKPKPASQAPAIAAAPDQPKTTASYDQMEAISPRLYGSLQRAYDFFGPELFHIVLPEVVFGYQPRARSGGHYAHERYVIRADGSKRSLLALNPDTFIGQSDRQITSVFVHEMAHVWQFAHGKPSGAYHNKQWADVMESLGLMPSNTGGVGGKRTGAKMSHYIIPDGPFDRAFDELESTGWRLEMESAPTREPDRKKSESKTKLTCPECAQAAWGKPNLAILCEPCGQRMLTKEQTAKALIMDPGAEDFASTTAH
jgi:hypothetical protein